MPSHRSRLSSWLLAIPLAVALALTPTGPAAATPAGDPDPAPGPDPATGPSSAATEHTTEVTLITGDRVFLQRDATGLTAASIEPAPRTGPAPSFETVTDDDGTYVFPSDAVALVPELLDPALFQLEKLAALDTAAGTPVIVSYDTAAARLATTPGLSVTAELPSIGGVAATVTGDGAWWAAAGPPADPAATAAARAAGPLAGVRKVWLDGLAEVALDVSGPLVGAPQAWAAGFDGTGVTIAVLDTGIDTGHPDLAGRVAAAENFTDELDVTDQHGHGTHVAGIAAGAGEVYRGVAPGAELLNGKVCDQAGDCQTSWIMAGMEWAAATADVVNMSFGTASGSDGTDPISQAVNTLTAQHDTLFVTSAGNTGSRGDGSVGSPGAADAALAVGSVTKQERLASTSSRGPRLGDFAIKPEITAPGVGIVAPRAAGTSLGTPVDDHYTSSSGTSMAAPHVAGAAAILAQQDPDRTAGQLKASLTNTGVPHPDLEVYQQGGGRLDIPTALAAPVGVDRATVDLGYFAYPHDGFDPVSAELSYRNRTDAPVTLDLSLAVVSRDGAVPPAGMLSLSPQTVTVGAGETATTTVTLDVTVGELGLYGGYLIATAGGEVVTRTPVGFHKEPELYTLTVEGIDRDGRPAFGGSSFQVLEVNDTSIFRETSIHFTDGVATRRVPPGTYHVMGLIYSYDGDRVTAQDRVLVGDPEVVVDQDTAVVLDARPGVPLQVETPAHPEAAPFGASKVSFLRTAGESGRLSFSWVEPWLPTYAVPTDPVSIGGFEMHIRTRLGDPGTSNTGYLYDLVFDEPDRIPDELTYRADPDSLVTIENRIHSDVPDQERGEFRHFWRPHELLSISLVTRMFAPHQRTEYVIGGENRYRQFIFAASPSAGIQNEPDTFYQPGERRAQSWFRTPSAPGVLDGGAFDDSSPTFRNGDVLSVRLQEWVDPEGHYGLRHTSVDTSALRLYEDGALIGEATRGFGNFPVSPAPATHRLELDVARDAPWWRTSTRTRTAWTLRSPGTGSGPVPLLVAHYQADVDLTNTAPPRLLQTVGLQIGHQPGADGPRVGRVRAWISYDDGTSWRPQPVLPGAGGRFTMVVTPQLDPGAEFASIRIAATDRAGNAIEQEVIRAWRLG